MINFDLLNFIIAVLAFLAALYSICYTHRQNRCHITISNCERYSEDNEHIIYCFEINNIGSSPVTLNSIDFLDTYKKSITPIIYEPENDPFSYTPDYMHANHLKSSCVLHPYQDLQLRYYLPIDCDYLTISIKSSERIHQFKKHQLFFVHFSDIE